MMNDAASAYAVPGAVLLLTESRNFSLGCVVVVLFGYQANSTFCLAEVCP